MLINNMFKIYSPKEMAAEMKDLQDKDLAMDLPEEFEEGQCQRCGDALNNADGEICQKCHIIETTNNNERHIDTLIEEKYEQR